MFSHQKAERFEKDRTSVVGPGSYDLPSTLDSKSPVIELSGRWQEAGSDAPGPGEYDPKVEEKGSETAAVVPTATLRRVGSEKENRAPSMTKIKKGSRQTLQAVNDGADTARQRQQDLRLAAQLDNVRDELKMKTRENKEMQLQVTAKAKKLEELQKRVEDLVADRREAHRRTAEVEGERDAKRRQLHEKEQDFLAQQRRSETLRAAAEEKSKRCERLEQEHKATAAEVQKLRSSAEGLQEKLAAAERESKAAEQGRAQQERHSAQLERRLQEHIAVLEESLQREEGRRREVEERAVRTGAEREQGETELAMERRRAEELLGRVSQLEGEVKAKLSEQKEQMERQHQLEDELSAAKARNTAQGDALKHAEDMCQELEVRAARAEVQVEAQARELATESAKVQELEAERQRFGESQYTKQQERLEEAEGKVRGLTHDLQGERDRCEELEQQVAELEEKERTATASLAAQNADAEVARAETEYIEALKEGAEHAEAAARTAEEQVRRWKEWADEQSLRELTAETQRLEELKRVREDVTRQVEAARHEVVEENKALRQRIQGLEAGPDGASALKQRLEEQEQRLEEKSAALRSAEAERADLEARLESALREVATAKAEIGDARGALDEAARKTEEDRRTLEGRVARAEADVSLAADEFTEERECLEAQIKALNIKHETAMATRDEVSEESRAAERQAAAQREAVLEEALTSARSTGALCRWRHLAEACLAKQFSAQVEEIWGQVRHTAHMWRSFANGHERDGSLLTRQAEELERLDGEAESLREQNRQLMSSLQQSEHELQWSLAETGRLQEREAIYEGDLLHLSNRSAELAGHSNPKQKIKHLMDLKAENNILRQEHKKAKQQVGQLEVQLRSAQFFDAVSAPLGDAAAGPAGGRLQTPRKPSMSQASGTPGRPAPRTPAGGGTPACGGERGQRDPLSAVADDRPEGIRREKAEVVRHARAHRRASERATLEYQHLAAIVEKVLSLHPTVSTVASSTVASSGMVTPEPRNGEAATGAADSGTLLRRLRDLAAELTAGGSKSGRQRREEYLLETPRTEAVSTTALSITSALNSPEPEKEVGVQEDSATAA